MAQRKPKGPIEQPDSADIPLDEVTATYAPRTELGRRLLELRAEIVRSGIPLLSWDEIEREVAERRGGVELREYKERHRS
jgi:hypothetical protein